MSNFVSVIAGVYLMLWCKTIQGFYSGYARGAQLGHVVYSRFGENQDVTHSDPYWELANFHLYLTWILVAYIVAKTIRIKNFSHFVSTPAALFATIGFCMIYVTTRSYSIDNDPYLDLMRETMPMYPALIFLSAALFMWELFDMFRIYGKLGKK